MDTLGGSCADLVVAAGNVQSNPSDSYSKKDLSIKAKAVNENVSYLIYNDIFVKKISKSSS